MMNSGKKDIGRRFLLVFIIFSVVPLLILFLHNLAAAVQGLDLYPDEVQLVEEADKIILVISIGNAGSLYPDENVKVEVKCMGGMKGKGGMLFQQIYTCPYEELGPGKNCIIKVSEWTPNEDFTLFLRIDPQNRLKEVNEKNNLYRKSFSISASAGLQTPGMCNLTIGKFYVVPLGAEKVSLRIHILNTGGASPSNDFSLELTWSPSVPGEKNRWNLKAKNHPPGSEVIISSGYISPVKHAAITFTAVVDPENKVHESDETDNHKSITYVRNQ